MHSLLVLIVVGGCLLRNRTLKGGLPRLAGAIGGPLGGHLLTAEVALSLRTPIVKCFNCQKTSTLDLPLVPGAHVFLLWLKMLTNSIHRWTTDRQSLRETSISIIVRSYTRSQPSRKGSYNTPDSPPAGSDVHFLASWSQTS